MLSWRDLLDQEVRREDLQMQAERWRLVQSVLINRPQIGGRLAATLVRLGAWMERTGCRIQNRFTDIESAVMLTTSSVETQLHGRS